MNATKEAKAKQDKLNKVLVNACDTFRGTVSADTYRDLLLTMLLLKYISDVWQDHYDTYQVEYGDEPELVDEMMKNERFVLPPCASFYALWERRHEPGNGERIDQAVRAIEDANGSKLKDSTRSVFQNVTFNTDRLGDEKRKNTLLRHVLEDFAKDELNLKPSRIGSVDMVGNACEYLIEHLAASGAPKARDFYTPAKVSELMAELLDPHPGHSICDPACGSATLLIKCGSNVRNNHGNNRYELYGQEASGSTWSLAKMNMFLHGEDNHKIEWGDTLRNPKLLDKNGNLMRFDIVAANLLFSLDKWGRDNANNDKFGRFRRGLPPKTKGDYGFILHMIETLKLNTGRMGVVVPHGVLFRGAAEGKIRKQLIAENLLDAVIGLPEKLFYGSGIPTAILIFRRNKTDTSTLFIDASRECQSGKNQNLLTEENIQKIVHTYRKGESVDKFAYVADLKEIQENDYNLNIPRYVDTFEKEGEVDLVAARAERAQLKAQLDELETEMAKHLEELGIE